MPILGLELSSECSILACVWYQSQTFPKMPNSSFGKTGGKLEVKLELSSNLGGGLQNSSFGETGGKLEVKLELSSSLGGGCRIPVLGKLEENWK